MTDGEALAELQLVAGASSGDVRAAYLRLLKVRKPDRDPEGFRRLRAAYELLQGGHRPEPEPTPVTAEPPVALEEEQEVAVPDLDRALAWLARELVEIGPAGFRVGERIAAIDFVYQRFPDVPQLVLQLLKELTIDGLFVADACEVASTYIRQYGERPNSVEVWRWILENDAGLLKMYQLEQMPSGLPFDLIVRTCIQLCLRNAEPFRAGQLLRRTLQSASEAELRAHDVLVVRAVLEIGHARFMELSCELAVLLAQRVQTPMTLLVGEWASLREELPAQSMQEMAWAILHRDGRPVRDEFELPPHLLIQLHALLSTRAPQVFTYLEKVLPSIPDDWADVRPRSRDDHDALGERLNRPLAHAARREPAQPAVRPWFWWAMLIGALLAMLLIFGRQTI